jgi:hypothetical protein
VGRWGSHRAGAGLDQSSGDDWASRLKTANPHAPPAPDAGDIRWGDTQTTTFNTAGTGIFGADFPQLIQATETARVWQADLSFSLPTVTALPTLPNFTVTVTFILILAVGASRITRYRQLFSTDLVGLSLNPAFPLVLTTPIASVVEQNLPAKQIIIGAHIEYNRILLAGPATLPVTVSAAVAPVFR